MTSPGSDAARETICEVAVDRGAIGRARALAEGLLAGLRPECREAVVMAVQELAENLTKYAAWEGPAGTISVCTRGDSVTIRARNHACSAADGEHATRTIEEINAAADLEALYQRRQRELLQDPTIPRGRLGLLRVALEGRFRLSYRYEHPVLEIVADRS